MPDLNGNTPGEKAPPPPPPPPHTPSRPTNNYASINSPIMSAKRSKKRTTTNNTTTLSPMHNPKHVPKDSHITNNNNEIIPSSNNNEELLDTNNSTDDGDNNEEGASWVGRKVDAIFSPVLSFLNGATTNSTDDDLTTTPYNNVELEDDNNDEKEDKVDDDKSEVLVNGNSNTNLGTESNTVDIDGDVTMVDHPKVGLENGVADDNQPEEEIADEDKYDEVEVYDDDEEDEFNPHLFIKCLPPYQYVLPPDWNTRPRALPPHDAEVLPPICLVLDLDETLVHCTVEPIDNADIIFPVNFNGTEYQVHVRYRPFLQEFLEAVSKTFEVVIFTASQQVYADQLLDRIDPDNKYIRHRLFRDTCLPVEGNFLKDLTVLGRDLSKAVLVDNSPHAFGYQVDNGIPIESWFDDPHDKELLKLEIFLRTLHGVEDVRDIVRETFQTRRLVLEA